ncbi:MAG TPA: C25 family cysteine peptidase [Anaerolineales bacterium]|nr:C25 family cysteine peptidase [Anaerolineales bacterium]
MTDRQTLLSLLHAARASGRADFGRQAATDWLGRWPGDAEIQLYLAAIEIEQEHLQPAIRRLRQVTNADPESVEAYTALARALTSAGDPQRAAVYEGCSLALRGEEFAAEGYPVWVSHLRQAIAALGRKEFPKALTEVQQALLADPETPLPTLIYARAQKASGEATGALATARAGHDRWPECVPFLVLIGEDLIRRSETARGVDYLHQAAALDPTGRVAQRYLGAEHAYQTLWPAAMDVALTRPIPADVAAVLGDNRLAASPAPTAPASSAPSPAPAVAESPAAAEQSHRRRSVRHETPDPSTTAAAANEPPSPTPEPWESFRGPDAGDTAGGRVLQSEGLVEIAADLERLASRLHVRGHVPDEDRRIPAYIVLTSRTRLIQQFGEDRTARLEDAVEELVAAAGRRQGWASYGLYIDDPKTVTPLGLTPADPGNAWQVKLRLADLDRALARRGEMIGALLIVGGHSVLPFHMLPNPTDDDDDAVFSDNPYATSDENYLAPEWPVGRLPSDKDADLLVRMIRETALEHEAAARPLSPVRRFRMWLARAFPWLFAARQRTLGYTASIWRKASMAVYRAIGDPHSMLTSPPSQVGSLPSQMLRPSRLSYYNLHGVPDAAEWFGQRDPLRDPEASEEFPVALRPEDIVNGGRAPRIVFSEACYGAHVIDRTSESALALKFLSSGSHAVVGSTRISYGSVTPPLIGADLLGRYFWDQLNQGLPVGEALRRAKLSLAAEMHRRQGYLDGEDQKTLISFVLYGDPMHSPQVAVAATAPKSVVRKVTRPTAMKVVCALGGPERSVRDLDPVAFERVKTIVSQYLPGLSDASARVHAQHFGCDGRDHVCPSAQLGVKGTSPAGRDNVVVTLTKQVQSSGARHVHFARLTLDAAGKVLKLAVSR